MADAQREGMTLLRSGCLQLLHKKGDKYEAVPSDILEQVVVTPKDELVPDPEAPGEDQQKVADRIVKLSLGPLFFHTSEVRECLVAFSTPAPLNDASVPAGRESLRHAAWRLIRHRHSDVLAQQNRTATRFCWAGILDEIDQAAGAWTQPLRIWVIDSEGEILMPAAFWRSPEGMPQLQLMLLESVADGLHVVNPVEFDTRFGIIQPPADEADTTSETPAQPITDESEPAASESGKAQSPKKMKAGKPKGGRPRRSDYKKCMQEAIRFRKTNPRCSYLELWRHVHGGACQGSCRSDFVTILH
jgi:hypothetical protein